MPKTRNPKFNLTYQYQLFLHRMGLSESTMHPEQKIQIKQTFYGAIGQMLILMRDDIGELPEQEGVEVFEDLLQQVNTYLNTEMMKPR